MQPLTYLSYKNVSKIAQKYFQTPKSANIYFLINSDGFGF
jgi:hypothetical protein